MNESRKATHYMIDFTGHSETAEALEEIRLTVAGVGGEGINMKGHHFWGGGNVLDLG